LAMQNAAARNSAALIGRTISRIAVPPETIPHLSSVISRSVLIVVLIAFTERLKWILAEGPGIARRNREISSNGTPAAQIRIDPCGTFASERLTPGVAPHRLEVG
jgi:hypothetical protein